MEPAHITAATKEFLNYGVAVAVLVPILTFILWAGRTIVLNLIEQTKSAGAQMIKQQDEFGGFMKELTSALSGINAGCQTCRMDTLSAVRDAETNVTVRIEHLIWEAHDKATLERKDLINGMSNKFDKALDGLASSIRASNEKLADDIENQRLRDELSRPHDITGATPRPVGR